MHDKIPVSVLITTLNEERNLARCLASVERFDEIIVIDSNSNDATPDIAKSFGVTFVNFTWNKAYPKKRQWCLDNMALKHDHVFFIDADEEATPALCDEIASLNWEADGYFVRGLYVVEGKILKFGFANKKLCLFDRRKIQFPVVDDLDIAGMGEIEGHYQPVFKEGIMGHLSALKNPVLHHALDDKARYIARHEAYAEWRKGMDLKNAHPADPMASRRFLKRAFQKMPFKTPVLLFYFYLIKGGFLQPANTGLIFSEKVKYHKARK